MTASPNADRILVVDDDQVLLQVLSRVLTREGYTVIPAADVGEAVQLAQQHHPRLALLDLCLKDGDGVELARKLHARQADLPLILMTAYPLRLSDHEGAAGQFQRVMTKPINLEELRQTVLAALSGAPVEPATRRPAWDTGRDEYPSLTREASESVSASGAGGRGSPTQPAVPITHGPVGQGANPRSGAPGRQPAPQANDGSPARTPFARLASTGVVVLVGGVLVGMVLWVTGVVSLPNLYAHAAERAPAAAPPLPVELVPAMPHTLAIPEDVRRSLGIRKGNTDLITAARAPTTMRPLVMRGSTMLDPTRLYRIRARFAPSPSSAKVIEIGQVVEDPLQSRKPQSTFREVRSGDHVHKGDLLAVFSSVDVGNLKNNLIDAMYQLELDQQILQKAENSTVVPEVTLLGYRKNVRSDINLINRTVATLKAWDIPEKDIQAVRDEAEEVKKRKGEHDKSKDALWDRVEMRAPDDGIIVERNLALGENVVDNTTNLFQIANVDQLYVYAYVPEDDLPLLEKLPTDLRRWTVKTVGSDPIPGRIDDVGMIIDPNQHTAVIKGHIDNPKGVLRGGQFITAAVDLPPPADVVEVPIDAVVDDGQQAVVFVEADAAKHYYTMRRVELTQRFDRSAFVRCKPFAKDEARTSEEEELGMQPKEPLLPGERVLLSGVGELKAALLDLESAPKQDPKADRGGN
jgi:cobalt-zinc-cadmium efflux system membrane fusion protein